MSGWIGVDLDGTLAMYDGWKGPLHIGEPIPLMVERVKKWISYGTTVKIFTARVAGPDLAHVEKCKAAIKQWLEDVGLPDLEVTNVKDYSMIQLWDDRAVQVVPNTGEAVGDMTSFTNH